MLGEAQAEVAVSIIVLVERIGIMPTTLQAIFAKLIPKHKGVPMKVSYRAIGLLPSLYRQWARLRKEEARRWEKRNQSQMLGHQAGRSIMEIVFLQALEAESAVSQDKPGKFGCFLWDLSNFYEHVDRRKLWQRAQARE